MWHRLVQALIAQPAHPLDQTDRFAKRPWDNGTNYDIPTFLRRRMVQASSQHTRPPQHGLSLFRRTLVLK